MLSRGPLLLRQLRLGERPFPAGSTAQPEAALALFYLMLRQSVSGPAPEKVDHS